MHGGGRRWGCRVAHSLRMVGRSGTAAARAWTTRWTTAWRFTGSSGELLVPLAGYRRPDRVTVSGRTSVSRKRPSHVHRRRGRPADEYRVPSGHTYLPWVAGTDCRTMARAHRRRWYVGMQRLRTWRASWGWVNAQKWHSMGMSRAGGGCHSRMR